MENILASLAYLDAVHDFHVYAEMYKHDLEPSLPRTLLELPTFKDEDSALYESMKYAQSMRPLNNTKATLTPNDIFQLLGGDKTHPVAIVCDSSFCSSLINILEKNTIGRVYFIKNREVVNDSGTNKHVKTKGSLFVANDIDEDDIKYPRFTANINNSNLHSTFDLELGYANNVFICKTYYNNIEIDCIEDNNEKFYFINIRNNCTNQ